jgi:hypothetical protein
LTKFVEVWEWEFDNRRLLWESVVDLAKYVARVTKKLEQMLLLDVEYTRKDARGIEAWAALLRNYDP